MVSDTQLIAEILELVDSAPLTKVDFAPLLEKHTIGMEFNEQREVRGAFRRVLLDLKNNGDIEYYDRDINISSSHGGNWYGHGGLIKSTLKRKEKLEDRERSNNISNNVFVSGNNHAPILNSGDNSTQFLSAHLPAETPKAKTGNTTKIIISIVKWIWDNIWKIAVSVIAGYILFKMGWKK